ncbi:hypothetical protein T459_34624 [Capsicum annuum]|uniref:Uncharacterized protein n=1 Tax=Capsicum annuum TaxID=4072 RepID=A0A2G2XVH9_CAPAN|nr:hypothetical protein T459_34624 [Capsicum annuum]
MGISPSLVPPSRGVRPGPKLRTFLQTTIRTTEPLDSKRVILPDLGSRLECLSAKGSWSPDVRWAIAAITKTVEIQLPLATTFVDVDSHLGYHRARDEFKASATVVCMEHRTRQIGVDKDPMPTTSTAFENPDRRSSTMTAERSKEVPQYHDATVPWYIGAMVPWCHGALVPRCLGDIEPLSHDAFVLWCHGALVPLCHGAMVPRFICAMFPWCLDARFHGATMSWCHGALVQSTTVLWFLGAMVPQCLCAMVPWCLCAMVRWCHGAFVPWFHGVLVPCAHDVPPYPNSSPDNAFRLDRPAERALGPKRGAVPRFQFTK